MEHRASQRAERKLVGDGYKDLGLVFASRTARRSILISSARRSTGRSPSARVPRIRLHDLRHTHATLLLQAGVPPKVVSERLGHATVAFTMQVYAHVIPGMQADAARAFGEFVFPTMTRMLRRHSDDTDAEGMSRSLPHGAWPHARSSG